MGYYSFLSWKGTATKINEKELNNLNNLLQTEQAPEGFENITISFNKTGELNLEMDEYYRKFYEDSKFANLLSKVIEEGEIEIHFTGEDGEKWGYRIKNNEINEIEELFSIMVSFQELRYLEKTFKREF